MSTRTIEINDTLDEILDSVKDDVKDLVFSYLDENKEEEVPDLYNDLDYDGSIHEIIDSSVPIYNKEINDLFYLYGDQFEESFENAGIGDKEDSHWPNGWKPAAIYCYIEQEIAEWYEEEKESLYDEWREKNPLNKNEEE